MPKSKPEPNHKSPPPDKNIHPPDNIDQSIENDNV